MKTPHPGPLPIRSADSANAERGNENLCPNHDAKEVPLHKVCVECPKLADSEWRKRGAILHMELRRHDLKFRELLIADLILDKTYGWSREAVMIQQLRYFTDFTGIGQPDVVKVLKSLHARRVIRVNTVKGQPWYAINPDSDAWKAMPRASKATMQSTLNVMREQNGLEPLPIEQEATLNFKVRPDARKTVANIGNFPMCESMGAKDGEFPNLY